MGMLEAEIDYEKEKTWKIQDKFPIEVTARKGWSGNYYTIEPKPMDISYDAFVDLGSGENVGYTSYDYTTGEAQWTSDSLEQIKQWEEDNQDKIKVIYPKSLNESKMPTQDQVDKFFSLTQNEIHYLNSKPVAGQEKTFNKMEVEPWDEYDLSNWNSLVRKAKSKGKINEDEDKLLKIKQELEALRPGTISWIDDIKISSYDGSLQVELDYTLYPNEIKQLAQIATKYGMELKYMTGKNATLVKNKINEDRKYNQEELLRLDLIAHRRFGCDYEKCTDEQKSEVLKDKIKVGVKEAINESKKDLDEAEFKGKKVALGKPKRGGPKAYYVYVKDGDKVKKVTFGSGGLRAKIKNKEARNAFAARHNCKDKKDRTKAGYWSCNLPRYAPALGLGAKMNTFW